MNKEVLTHYGLSHQVTYNVNPYGHWPANIAGSNSNKVWISVIVLITGPEESYVNEEALTDRKLSHQIKYIVGPSGRSSVEIMGSNSTKSLMWGFL